MSKHDPQAAMVEDLREEREFVAQELFESNRYAESLVLVRQQMTELLDDTVRQLRLAEERAGALEAERDALLGQRLVLDAQLADVRETLIERTRTAEALVRENQDLRRREDAMLGEAGGQPGK